MILGKALRTAHQRFFTGRRWYRVNALMYDLGLRGLGVLNSENDDVSGENALLRGALTGAGAAVVLDVGANVGDYARKAKAIAPDARVFAFEPHPATFRHTAAAGAAAGFLAINQGCGERAGTLTLYDYDGARDGSQHASLYRDVIEGLHGGRAAAHEVPITTVDAFLHEQGIDVVRLLKIDTEGHEASVLRGARDALAAGRIELVQFEFNAMHVTSRTFFKDLVELLPGYRLYRLLSDGLVALRYDPLRCEIFAFQNVVAVRADVRPPAPVVNGPEA